ncbi:hypothetical protein [Sinorhizobium fredii]|uniref:Uncharacterized protein n=1 Tax=Rhizobium fredii TaxID=380 RepID=A0A2A6LR62_RHIFR|nr:hypothetical protein [Sinorhizobium fredii]PDT44875.1 hypothetical protein CO661_26815 [Sinorhizobium fredii]
MRILVTTFTVFALAAAPCAWDRDPRQPSVLAALFDSPARGPTRAPTAGMQRASAAAGISEATSADDRR